MMKPLLRLTAITAALVAGTATAAPTIGLSNGVAQSFPMPAESFTNSFYVDTAAADTTLKIELSNSGTGDLDLFLRYGSPFPENAATGGPPSYDFLLEHTQYYALSPGASETIEIGRSNAFPVQQGRWYIIAFNYGGATTASLRATMGSGATPGVPIEIVTNDASGGCGIAPWSDSTARPAAGGNAGTTLGQQRVNALRRAAELLANEIKSPVPIRVQACWENLGTGNQITLAQAGPTYLLRNDEAPFVSTTGGESPQRASFLPRNMTWYAIAPATKLAGTRGCSLTSLPCNEAYDIRATFNDQVDTDAALGTRGYWYGFSPQSPAADVDFISTAMHEITHGLGFAGTIIKSTSDGVVGSEFLGSDDIYSANVAWVKSEVAPVDVQPLSVGTDADRIAAMTSISNLRWIEAAATNSLANPYRAFGTPPANFVRLHAPNPLQPGSSLSHLANATAENSLMLASVVASPRTLGLAGPMMGPLGWSDAAATPPVNTARPTQYYDPAHTGHGINFGRVAGDLHYMIFYTYGANGEPEYYIATGNLVDGVFRPADNANGDSLLRIRYNAGQNPPQSPDPNVRGRVRLDFNDAQASAACQDGRQRDTSSPLAVMTWSIGNDRNIQWCMQAVLPENLRPAVDYTGAYFASAQDQGWGFDFLGLPGGGTGPTFGALIYYPDAQGNGRWAYVQQGDVQNGATYQLFERRGYCRTCPIPPNIANGQFDDVPAGTISFVLNGTGQAATLNNRVTFSVTYQRDAGGTFARTNSPLVLISQPQP